MATVGYLPKPGYLETGELGPVPVREVEWLDVARLDQDGHDQIAVIERALVQIETVFSSTADSIRIVPQVSK